MYAGYAPIENVDWNREAFAHLLEHAEAVFVATSWANFPPVYRVLHRGALFTFRADRAAGLPQNGYYAAVTKLIAGDRWVRAEGEHEDYGSLYIPRLAPASAPFPVGIEAAEFKCGFVQRYGKKLTLYLPPTPFVPARRVEYDLERISERTLALLADALASNSERTFDFESDMTVSTYRFTYYPPTTTPAKA